MSLTVLPLTPNYQSVPDGVQKKNIYSKVVKSSNDARHIEVVYKYNGEPYRKVIKNQPANFEYRGYNQIFERDKNGEWVLERTDFYNTSDEILKANKQLQDEFENLQLNGPKINQDE